MNANYAVFATVNAEYAVLRWEPVLHSEEFINVGAIAIFENDFFAKSLIRADVLQCMYGSAASGIMEMILKVLEALLHIGKKYGWETMLDSVPLANFTLIRSKKTYAIEVNDLFRQIVLMHCSLSIISDESEVSAADNPESERDVNQQWLTKIKNALQIKKPHLEKFFNKEALIVENGMPVKFGFLNTSLVAHFGMLRVGAQMNGVKDARAKILELSLAKNRNHTINSALIFGLPHKEDVTINDKQRSRLIDYTSELEREANHYNILFKEVYSADEAANLIIDFA